ncbi:hypothetical protein GUJ93_ZPchr0012g21268 [Zizania palustris]|uniref:Uncharacterized protein n=1 Tax=Zizania palustris TaxID=103762 RepID=A0A8J6BWG5_ZIZPA|nr:hypothetical protein GUJ93_ZPchr0012g21268 [Zizania palustris]
MLLFSPIRSLPSLSPSAFSSLSASLAVLSPRWPSSASAHTAHLSAPSSRHAWHECAAVASPNQFSTSSGTATPPPNGHNSNPGAFSPPSVRSHDVARPPPSPRCVTLYRCPCSPRFPLPRRPSTEHRRPCSSFHCSPVPFTSRRAPPHFADSQQVLVLVLFLLSCDHHP